MRWPFSRGVATPARPQRIGEGDDLSLLAPHGTSSAAVGKHSQCRTPSAVDSGSGSPVFASTPASSLTAGPARAPASSCLSSQDNLHATRPDVDLSAWRSGHQSSGSNSGSGSGGIVPGRSPALPNVRAAVPQEAAAADDTGCSEPASDEDEADAAAEAEYDALLDELVAGKQLKVGFAKRVEVAVQRLLQSNFLAVILDIMDGGLYFLDIITDIRVLKAFQEEGYHQWLALTILFITWHYALMAVLVIGYMRRLCGFWVDARGRKWRHPTWLLVVPVALPLVVALDLLMVVTSLLPIMRPQERATQQLSSFLSNYNFTRLFVEFVMESIPQTVLQTYIIGCLITYHQATKLDITIITTSLFISTFNVAKYTWKLRKAQRQAGMAPWEYWKYVLLLKGNYECSPMVMQEQMSLCAQLSAGGSTLLLDGFLLYQDKTRFGPAQQANILLSSLHQHRDDPVTRVTVAGCPLPCINRILQRALLQFPGLQELELRECSFRGNSWQLVVKAMKEHPSLHQLRLVQSGVLPKYKNFQKASLPRLFKAPLSEVALVVPWLDGAMMADAAKRLAGSTSLTSLSLEVPLRGRGASASELHFLKKYSLTEVTHQWAWALAGLLNSSSGARALAHLSLVNQPLGDVAVTSICRAASYSTCLVTLSLQGSSVGDQGADEVAQLLRSNSVLTSLDLRGCGLHAAGISTVAASLADNRTLTRLDLSANEALSSAGLAALAKATRSNSSLKELLLEDAGLEASRAAGDYAELGQALGSCPQLQVVSLAGCVLVEEALARLGKGLAASSSLQQLDLRRKDQAGRTDGGSIPGVVRALAASNTSLTSLDLSGHLVTPAAAAALGELLRVHSHLQQLRLGDTGLQDAQLLAICAALPAAPALTELTISKAGPIGLPGARALASALTAPTGHLQVLDMSFCTFSADADEAVAQWSVLAGSLACWARSRGSRLSSTDPQGLLASANSSRGATPRLQLPVGCPWSAFDTAEPGGRADSSPRAVVLSPAASSGPLAMALPGSRLGGRKSAELERSSSLAAATSVSCHRHSCGGCRLRHLNLSRCGLTDTGAESLAAALASNVALTHLDLAGYSAEAAQLVFKKLLGRCRAAAMLKAGLVHGEGMAAAAVAALPCRPRTSMDLSLRAAAGVGGQQLVGCGVRVFNVTGPQYKVVNLLEVLPTPAAAAAGSNQLQQQQQPEHRSGQAAAVT